MKRARVGLAAFEARAGEAARTLLHNQGYDGGWGLTLTSVSSIVNTSEVLPILRAAGIAGQPVRQALDFLTGAIVEHCRPRHKGGRGEHTRFIAFGLAGLLSQTARPGTTGTRRSEPPRCWHAPGVPAVPATEPPR
ncbi:hypothetical protein ACWF94_02190 [Streptomyces sp. NPDC055078]